MDVRIPNTMSVAPSLFPRPRTGPYVPRSRRLGTLGRLEGLPRHQNPDWKGWNNRAGSNNQHEAPPSRGPVAGTLGSGVYPNAP